MQRGARQPGETAQAPHHLSTAAPKNLDDARLLPHLRRNQEHALTSITLLEPSSTFGAYTSQQFKLKNGKTIKKTIVPMPGDLRGFPVAGHGGAMRNTRPERHVPHKIDRERAA